MVARKKTLMGTWHFFHVTVTFSLHGYATTPKTVSMRNKYAGSWYIQELREVLHENKHDLVTMVTLVHDAVATKPQYCYEWTEDKTGKRYMYRQQPQMISMLRHRVKF